MKLWDNKKKACYNLEEFKKCCDYWGERGICCLCGREIHWGKCKTPGIANLGAEKL